MPALACSARALRRRRPPALPHPSAPWSGAAGRRVAVHHETGGVTGGVIGDVTDDVTGGVTGGEANGFAHSEIFAVCAATRNFR